MRIEGPTEKRKNMKEIRTTAKASLTLTCLCLVCVDGYYSFAYGIYGRVSISCRAVVGQRSRPQRSRSRKLCSLRCGYALASCFYGHFSFCFFFHFFFSFYSFVSYFWQPFFSYVLFSQFLSYICYVSLTDGMLSAGWDLIVRCFSPTLQQNGVAALHVAAVNGNRSIAIALIKGGASLTLKTKVGS